MELRVAWGVPSESASQSNMELQVAWGVPSGSTQAACVVNLPWTHLTTLHGHPVHVGCLEGAIRRNKTTQVQFGIMTPPLVGPAILPFPAAI